MGGLAAFSCIVMRCSGFCFDLGALGFVELMLLQVTDDSLGCDLTSVFGSCFSFQFVVNNVHLECLSCVVMHRNGCFFPAVVLLPFATVPRK